MHDIRAYRTLVHFMASHPSGAKNEPVKIQWGVEVVRLLG